MEQVWNWIKAAFAAAGVAAGVFLGGVDIMLWTLLGFVTVDYLTGLLGAFIERKVSSAIGARGIAKKVMIFLLVGLAHLLDTAVLGGTAALRGAVICFYIANEGISVLENTARLGLPVPERMRAALAQLKEKEEK